MSGGARLLRMMVLDVTVALAVGMTGVTAVAAQSVDGPQIVDIPPPAPGRADRPSPPVARDPNAIPGIRIEENGALITGPVNARRVYISLDRPALPNGFQGVWAGSPDLCAGALQARGTHAIEPPPNTFRIEPERIVARNTMTMAQIFIPLPSSITWEMLESGRRLVEPSSRYRDADTVLAIYTTPDGARGHIELNQSDDGRRLALVSQRSRETAVRCAG